MISETVRAGLAGLENLAGIPGTIGGALHGNAGGRHGEISQYVRKVTVLTASGEKLVRSEDELLFDYRQSNFDELLILDADAAKRRDIDCYRDKFTEGCWMIIDDIYGTDANEKIPPSRADVDALVAEGLLQPLGFYGWSTWVGRWR